ncbi:MAG: LPS export ABC transporter permease LptF [Deltaproteobacteria bacterium]|nr:LPS export ABC transporter permease LptF [Deltaproteobacteria bacterium]
MPNDNQLVPRRPFRILTRYILSEIFSPFLVTLFVFTGILFLAKSIKLIELVINRNVSIWDIGQLFFFVVPQFFELALPMALLLGTILAFGRLSADSELIVMRATGISLRTLLWPVLWFATGVCVLGIVISFWVRPWANYMLGLKLFEMAQMKASATLTPGVFNSFGRLTIYAESLSAETGSLEHVVISDRREPERQRTFVAQNGTMISDPEKLTMTLRLFDGSIHEGIGERYNVTYFDLNSIVVDPSDMVSEGEAREGKKANEMIVDELITEIRTAPKARGSREDGEKASTRSARLLVEFHRRIAVPFSCIVVVLIGMALGVQPSRDGKSWGAALNIAVGILFITIYYFAIAFATALGEQKVVQAGVAMWLPNLLFGLIGCYLFRQIETEEWAAVSQAMSGAVVRVASWFRFGRDRRGEAP